MKVRLYSFCRRLIFLDKLVSQNPSNESKHVVQKYQSHAKTVFENSTTPEIVQLFDQLDWVQTDINDIPSLDEAFSGITHVYHCAAWISFNPKYHKEIRKINIEGTATIVNLCLHHKVKKLCHVSSIASLGNDPSVAMYNENAEWNPEIPKSIYAISKYGAEMEVWRGTQEGLHAVIVNPGIIIGPGFFNSGSGLLFKKIHDGLKFYTTGTSGYIAVEDVVNLMIILMEGQYSQERYVLVAENLSFKDAFGMIASGLGKKLPNRKTSPRMMKIAYYMQIISHYVFRTKRTIFKSSIRSAFATRSFDNKKIKAATNHEFIPVEQAIKTTAKAFLDSF